MHDRAPDDGLSRWDEYIETAWVPIEGTFDDYWAGRGKNLRQNLRKQRNRLAGEGTSITLREWSSPADMQPAVARYGELESHGWKAETGTAIHPDNPQGRFYVRWLEEAARRGEAVVYEYLFGDKTAAMHLCLRRGREIVILKTTYDEAFRAASPAQLLHEDELKGWFGSRTFDRVEYYGRVMDWHTKWTAHTRPLCHLSRYRWNWVKAIAMKRRARTQRAISSQTAAEVATPQTAGSGAS